MCDWLWTNYTVCFTQHSRRVFTNVVGSGTVCITHFHYEIEKKRRGSSNMTGKATTTTHSLRGFWFHFSFPDYWRKTWNHGYQMKTCTFLRHLYGFTQVAIIYEGLFFTPTFAALRPNISNQDISSLCRPSLISRSWARVGRKKTTPNDHEILTSPHNIFSPQSGYFWTFSMLFWTWTYSRVECNWVCFVWNDFSVSLCSTRTNNPPVLILYRALASLETNQQ